MHSAARAAIFRVLDTAGTGANMSMDGRGGFVVPLRGERPEFDRSGGGVLSELVVTMSRLRLSQLASMHSGAVHVQAPITVHYARTVRCDSSYAATQCETDLIVVGDIGLLAGST